MTARPSSPFPTLFVSHGSPMMALTPGDTGRFLERLGRTLDASHGRPTAVLAVSAHTTARAAALLGGTRHQAVHDFGGFPRALYELRYDAPGAPALAQRLADESNIPVVDAGGLDHGIWTALRYLYPEADVPVLPLALPAHDSPRALMALGQRLAPLSNEGVLVLATGSITHNLRLMMRGDGEEDAPEQPESALFRRWFADRSAARDWEALADYRQQAPHAVLMHPTDEHLLPWYVAAGAGGDASPPVRLHDAVTYGCIGMDAYAFGPGASDLARALVR